MQLLYSEKVMENVKQKVKSLGKSLLVGCLVYCWGVFEFSILWVLIFAFVYVHYSERKEARLAQKIRARQLFEEGEENYLKVNYVSVSASILLKSNS